MGFRSAKPKPERLFGDAPVPRTEPESSTLRAFSLLELIAAADEPPTLEDLTRASGLPKPSVYRILQLLIRGELVEREVSAKRYIVGARVAALSLAVQMRSPLRRERRAILSAGAFHHKGPRSLVEGIEKRGKHLAHRQAT